MGVDIHQLASLPHGEANKELQRLGFWREPDEDGNLPNFTVTVEASFISTEIETIEVFAESEEEACRVARRMIRDDPSEFFDAAGGYDHMEVEEVKAAAMAS